MSRAARSVLLGAALVSALLVGAPGQATAAVRVAAPTVSPSTLLAGETTTVSGSLGQAAARTVRLQRKVSGTWRTSTTGRTDGRGRYSFTRRVAGTTTYRVHAPATRSRPSRVSSTRTVKVVRDGATSTVAGTTDATTVSVTAAVPRPGRPVRLQRRTADGWSTVAGPLPLDARGRATITGIALPDETAELRVVLAAWRGAAQHAAPSTRFHPVPASMLPTQVPTIDLRTDDLAPVDSKETYVRGTFEVDGRTLPMGIRGRGNSTWVEPKKPYRIKLDAAASLLGMPAERDWVLLANHKDPTLLRGTVAFEIGRRLDILWTPQVRHVEVSLNGRGLGSYVLTEQVEPGAHRVPLPADGMLLEVDERRTDDEPGFRSRRGTPLTIKDPGAPGAERVEQLRAVVESLEDRLAGDEPWDAAGVVDHESTVDWYLLNELFKNVDADFFSSVFLTWGPSDPFRFATPWDFDTSAGNEIVRSDDWRAPSGWWLRGGPLEPTTTHLRHEDHWLVRMLADEGFAALVAERWREVRPMVTGLLAGVEPLGDRLSASATRDRAIWDRDTTTYAADVAAVHSWLEQRVVWLDANLEP